VSQFKAKIKQTGPQSHIITPADDKHIEYKYFIDPNAPDQGAATGGGSRSIKDFVDSIGTSMNATLFLPHTRASNTTTYTLTTSETIPSNIALEFGNGAVLAGAGTLTINGPFSSGLNQCFNMSGGIAFGAGSVQDIHLDWFGFSSDATAANNDTYFTNAVASMSAGQRLIVPAGTTEIENVVFNPTDGCGLVFNGILESGATGTALTVGSTATYHDYYHIENLKVNSSTKDHTAGRIGVLFANVQKSYINIRRVYGFETGVKLFGYGQGCVYNEVHLGNLLDNKYSLHLDSDSNGWCNENNFYGGSFQWSSSTDTAGFRHIWLDYYATNQLNNTRFYGASLESTASAGLDTAVGIYNESLNSAFFLPRFEMDSNNTIISNTANCDDAVYFFGYGLYHIAQTNISDSGARTKVWGGNSIRFGGGIDNSDTGILHLTNTSTEGTAPVISIHGTDDVVNGKFFGDGSVLALKYSVGANQVVGAQQTGISAMTNVTPPANWDADTVTTAELADIVGTLITKLRTHGLVAN